MVIFLCHFKFLCIFFFILANFPWIFNFYTNSSLSYFKINPKKYIICKRSKWRFLGILMHLKNFTVYRLLINMSRYYTQSQSLKANWQFLKISLDLNEKCMLNLFFKQCFVKFQFRAVTSKYIIAVILLFLLLHFHVIKMFFGQSFLDMI